MATAPAVPRAPMTGTAGASPRTGASLVKPMAWRLVLLISVALLATGVGLVVASGPRQTVPAPSGDSLTELVPGTPVVRVQRPPAAPSPTPTQRTSSRSIDQAPAPAPARSSAAAPESTARATEPAGPAPKGKWGGAGRPLPSAGRRAHPVPVPPFQLPGETDRD